MARGGEVCNPGNGISESEDWFGNISPAREEYLVDLEEIRKVYTVVDSPEEADFALVVMRTPISPGFSPEDVARGGIATINRKG